jgi:hypothetical protein
MEYQADSHSPNNKIQEFYFKAATTRKETLAT